jgi:3-isopropylmalate dehydrogenase
MKLNIALLAGDGIGPEVINEAVKFRMPLSIMKSLGTGACAIDAVGVLILMKHTNM